VNATGIEPTFLPLVQLMEERIPFNKHMGLKAVALSAGHAVLRLPWANHLIGDPMRPAVHGGVFSMLADTAGGAACFSLLDKPTDRVSTVDLRIDYLRPGVTGGDIFCVADVVRMGNRVAVARMGIYCGTLPEPGTPERDQPIATGQAVYNVVRQVTR
jgi:uncharacterized protein (TIGR00369 family)